MQKYIKILLFTPVFVLLAAGCNKAQPQPTNQPISTSANQSTQDQPLATTPSGTLQTLGSAKKPNYQPGFIIVSQTVEGSKTNDPYIQILDSATARDLLTVVYKVDFKNYGSIGDFVEKIDGVAPDSKHFWEFLVNGKSSNVGLSAYKLKNGDKIEWKLTEIK